MSGIFKQLDLFVSHSDWIQKHLFRGAKNPDDLEKKCFCSLKNKDVFAQIQPLPKSNYTYIHTDQSCAFPVSAPSLLSSLNSLKFPFRTVANTSSGVHLPHSYWGFFVQEKFCPW